MAGCWEKDMKPTAFDVVREFMNAWEACDLDRLLAVVDDEIIFVGTTGPEPGRTYSGKEAFRKAVTPLLSPALTICFRPREMFDAGETIIATWETIDSANQLSHSRMIGIDIFRVSNGKVILKDAYRKSY